MEVQPTPAAQPAPPPPRRGGSNTRLLLGLTIAGLALLGASVAGIWYALGDKTPAVEENTFLRVELEGELTDTPVAEGFFYESDDIPPTVSELAEALRHAATDDRIEGVLIELEEPRAGWASMHEIRDGLLAFKEAGKPCVVYQHSAFTTGQYYLASACQYLIMPEAGVLLVNGVGVELSYFKGTFDKIGVTPEFEHVGDFKSFIETYERTGPSEQAAAAYDALLDSLWGEARAAIAQGRGVSEEQVQAWVDKPTLAPTAARANGMIDAMAFADAVRRHIRDIGEEGWQARLDEPPAKEDDDDKVDDAFTDVESYLSELRHDQDDARQAVAVINAEGQIISGGNEPSFFGDDGMLTDGEFSDWMEEAREDDRVKAVVVRVNSPGGSALAAAEMLREVQRTQAAGKPVVISMGDLAASGGYLMACKADRIVAQPNTITGSIGVFGGKFALAGTYEKIGVTTHSFKRGAQAGLLSATTPFTDEERQTFRAYLEDFYNIFVQDVADGRKKSFDDTHTVAQGRVWTGTQALERGLVDELGGVDVAVQRAAELANLDKPGIVRLPERKGFFDMLMEDLDKSQIQLELGAVLPEGLRRELAVLESAGRTGGIVAMLPGNFDAP